MLPKNNNRYIVFLDLPRIIQNRIDAVKKKYSPHNFKKWPSHITFKYDEEYLVSQKLVTEAFRKFFEDIGPVRLTLGKPTINFLKKTDGWNICIPIINEVALRTMVKDFSKMTESLIDFKSSDTLSSTKWEQSQNYYPHISIKGGIGRSKGENTYKHVLGENFYMNFPVNIVCATVTLAQWKKNKWKKVDRVNLHKKYGKK